jgi:type II secretory pathway predicted ATPase ExeA
MFLDFYKMKDQPFGVTPDPRFLYLGQSHREALASLFYGIECNRGFAALIAQPGLGKTTLTFQLLEKLQENSRVVFLFQTQCSSKELFQYLLNGLGVDTEKMDLVTMHNKLNQILSREMLAGRQFILAIDEAQNLGPEVLETIRLLSNFETSRGKMLQILLIGQPQLARKLATPEMEQLQQRISVFARLQPFAPDEIPHYIAHRLQVAGYQGGQLFSTGAVQLIAQHSHGIPRKINSLCFSSLSLACATGRNQVDAAIVEEVIADRDIESLQKPRVAPLVAPPLVAVTPSITPHAPLHPPLSSPAPSRPTLSIPGKAHPELSSLPEHRERSFALWAMATVCIAALVATGIGTLAVSPRNVDQANQKPSVAWVPIRNVAASIRNLFPVKSNSTPDSSTLNVQAAELSTPKPVQPSLSDHDAEINVVVVLSGETLRQILLRTVGEYNQDTIEQVRKLNVDIADFDHLEAGQRIRLPRISMTGDSETRNEGTNAAGKD